MKKTIFATMLLGTLTLGFISCGSDDEEINDEYAVAYDANKENITAWGNYMAVTSELLRVDAEKLYASWYTAYDMGKSYADMFKEHNNKTYGSAIKCVETIFDGCIGIVGKVQSQKIGKPYDLKVAGKNDDALNAVVSWYSWHSRDIFANNINSVRNAYFGTLDGTVSENSLSALLAQIDEVQDEELREAIDKTTKAMQAIPQPFHKNIDSKEAQTAQQRCASLSEKLTAAKSAFQKNFAKADADLDPVIEQYVNRVVLPTYKDLQEKTAALNESVQQFRANPSNAGFATCCQAWLKARAPWETSEAFLFGPVVDMGLNPNMDTWPLDQVGMVRILQSQNFNELKWEGVNDEDSKKISNAQSLRGFHALEYLIYKDGNARTLKTASAK